MSLGASPDPINISLNKFTHVISYDLHQPGQDYKKLHEAIEELGQTNHYLASTWLVRTNIDMSATNVRDHLTPHIDSNDKLLVARISGEVQAVKSNIR